MSTEPSRQEQLEGHAMDLGQKQFKERLARSEKAAGIRRPDAETMVGSSTEGAGNSLVRQGIQPLSLAIEHVLRESLKTRGVKHIITKTIPQLGPQGPEGETPEQEQARLADACDVAAYMTLRVVLNAALATTSLTTVAYEVADLLTDQVRYSRLQQEAPRLFDYKMGEFKTSNYAHRKRSLDATLRTAKVKDTGKVIDTDDVDLTDAQRLALGVKLVDLLIQSTGLVEIETGEFKAKRRSRKYRQAAPMVVATEETLAWLAEGNERMQFLMPVALPMVEKPLPWAPGVRGGYRYHLRNKYRLVRRVSKAHERTLNEAQMPAIYEAVNRIQSTAWRINPDVLSLIEEIVERGGGVAGVPALREVELPGKPAVHEGFEQTLKERRKEIRLARTEHREANLAPMHEELAAYAEKWRVWRKKASACYDVAHERKIARNDMERLLQVARLLKDDPELYFVWNLDFRGRIYPVTGNYGISPQGNDKGKALLTFAHGKPLGRDGVRYLAQHMMSCLGETPDGLKVSKMTIQQRVQWVRDNAHQILDVAARPFEAKWWMQADEPLMFFAACREWARLVLWSNLGSSEEDFMSSLPCFTDGSCNGLQHFGGLLQCAETGKAVNLLPTTEGMTPADIYSAVMEKAKAIIIADAADPSQQEPVTRTVKRRIGGKMQEQTVVTPSSGLIAQMWIQSGLLTRSMFKRPVMTFPYGSKTFGFRSQILEALKKLGDTVQESRSLFEAARRVFSSHEALAKADAGETKALGDHLGAAATYLAEVTMLAIEDTVVKAAEGMKWLQQAARLVASNGKAVSWTVPATGFTVRQEYFVSKEKRVETVLCGKVYKPCVYEPTPNPKALKQANSMSPNFIHSLDAACLMLTVNSAALHGVESFAMIHDSYGAPAGDCVVLAQAARQSFVNLYTKHDVIVELRDQLMAQVDEEGAERLTEGLPEKGTLDVSGVLASEFFFA